MATAGGVALRAGAPATTAKGVVMGKGGFRPGSGRPAGSRDRIPRGRRTAPRALVAVTAELARRADVIARERGLTLRQWMDRAVGLQLALDLEAIEVARADVAALCAAGLDFIY